MNWKLRKGPLLVVALAFFVFGSMSTILAARLVSQQPATNTFIVAGPGPIGSYSTYASEFSLLYQNTSIGGSLNGSLHVWDGHVIVTADTTVQDNVFVFKHDGTNFSVHDSMQHGQRPSVVSTGDFNNDGNIDLIIGEFDPGLTVSFYNFTNGTIGAVKGTLTPTGFNQRHTRVLVSDVDGDGLNDVVLGFQSQDKYVRVANSTVASKVDIVGLTPAGSEFIELCDVDGNGIDEIVVPGNGTVGIYNGTGDLVTSTSLSGNVAWRVAIGNLTRGATNNIVVYNDSAVIVYRFDAGASSLVKVGEFTGFTGIQEVFVGDLDSDGHDELLVATGGTIRVINNVARPLFDLENSVVLNVSNTVDFALKGIQVADLTGDGRNELVTLSDAGNVLSIYRVNILPNATFYAEGSLSVATGASVQFRLAGSPGNPVSQFQWDFGDGSDNSTQMEPSHVYTTPGTFTVTLTIIDGDGDSDVFTREGYITVSDQSGNPWFWPLIIGISVGVAAFVAILGIMSKRARDKARTGEGFVEPETVLVVDDGIYGESEEGDDTFAGDDMGGQDEFPDEDAGDEDELPPQPSEMLEPVAEDERLVEIEEILSHATRVKVVLVMDTMGIDPSTFEDLVKPLVLDAGMDVDGEFLVKMDGDLKKLITSLEATKDEWSK